MNRPRKHRTGLPKYCYRDKRGKLYMLRPVGKKLKRETFADLEALLAAWRVTWGEAATKGKATVGDLLDAFLSELGPRVKAGEISEGTAKDYERRLRYLRPVWADVRIDDVDVPMLYRWRDARGLKGRTQANRERTILFEAFKIAIREGTLTTNPVQHLKPFKERPRTRYVTDVEFMAVYEKAGPAVRAAMVMAAVTGLRQGDILRVRRSDFDDAGLHAKTRKTGAGLVIGWSDGLKIAVTEATNARAFIPMHLISTETGKPYTSDGFRSLWHRAMTAAREADPSLQPYTFNDLRAKAGTDGRDWRLLGHLDERTFNRVYNRLPRKVTPAR